MVSTPADLPKPKARGRRRTSKDTLTAAQTLASHLDQAGDFPTAAREVLNEARQVSHDVLDANNDSMHALREAVVAAMATISSQLDQPHLDAQTRQDLTGQIRDLVQLLADKDTENKAFLRDRHQDHLRLAAYVAGGVVTLGLVAAGRSDVVKELASQAPKTL